MPGESERPLDTREETVLDALQTISAPVLSVGAAHLVTQWCEREDADGLFPDFVLTPVNPRACPLRVWLNYGDEDEPQGSTHRNVVGITLGIEVSSFLAYLPQSGVAASDELAPQLRQMVFAVFNGGVTLVATPERIDPEWFVDGEPAPEDQWKDGWSLLSKLEIPYFGSSSSNLIEGDLHHPLTGEIVVERIETTFTFEPY